jgi:rSAM/selenodomain-associated transferase 1
MSAALAVIAKAPVPGRVKTRLCPPCTPAQAAGLAAAALRDTLDAVRATPVARRVLVLDGPPGPWAAGLEVVPQRGAGLAERLAHAFADVGGPALVIGMDTPQVTPELLADGLAALRRRPAVIGPADDGGYWAIGLRRADPRVFAGVPMSRATTGARQHERLRALGLAVHRLPSLRDVDDVEDALAVAALAPAGRFAPALAALTAVAT